MEIKFEDIEKLIAICKKNKIQSIRVDNIELQFQESSSSYDPVPKGEMNQDEIRIQEQIDKLRAKLEDEHTKRIEDDDLFRST
ncbi:MAG: hypothetical protein GY861_01085 [bacterium]|nr:hypothetical protein [bacterium]